MQEKMRRVVQPTIIVMILLLGGSFIVAPETVVADQLGDYTYTVSGGYATITKYTGLGGAVTIPRTLLSYPVVTIGVQAFYALNSVISVTIPNSVTTIDNSAFSYCQKLVSVTIPSSVTTIGISAFYMCNDLTSITIPNGVTYIANGAFYYCSSLTSITIPNSVTTINNGAFTFCTALTSVTIGSGVTSIGDNAFSSCSALTSLTIPSGVTSIGIRSFAYTTHLTSISFLGLVHPTSVGANWINYSGEGLTGHAYAASNFPAPGGNFEGLTMGTIIPAVPSIPTHFSAVAGNRSVVLSWGAPADGGTPITNYKLYRSLTYGGSYSLINSPSATTYNNTGLTNGQVYWYKVAAVNAVGEGRQSESAAGTPFTVPDAPTGVTATPGNGQVTLSWDAPFDGGRDITLYHVYRVNGRVPSLIASPTGTTYIDIDKTNGYRYSYIVSAVSSAGEGADSDLVSAIPFTLPSAPSGLVATPGDGRVTLSWTAPNDNGRIIDYYVVFQNGVPLAVHPTALTTIITGLSNGTGYSFTVAAHNLAGNGASSSAAAATPFGLPGAPSGLVAAAGNTNVTLNWTAPFNGGRDIDHYVIYQDGIALPDPVIDTIKIITGLTNGQSYAFRVVAHNIAGNGSQSTAASATPMTLPGAPTGLTATPGNGKLTLAWLAPT
ncbi:MAG: leucine-rich repeat protein, partial [Methanomassiliicoccales archaeon]